jgi:putative component of membrane protein insertase Oxa1/YidC/SpoIIIJ protein YidD
MPGPQPRFPASFGKIMAECLSSEEEPAEAEKYVLEKELIRPKTSILTVLKYYFVFSTSTLGVTVLGYFFLLFCFPRIARDIQFMVENKPFITLIIVWAIFHVIGFLVVLKPMVIGFVHLYQHYSPEELRRNCLFKPTCSEYMLLAIEKYGLFKGVIKSFGRFKRCNGDTYSIDYP